MDSSKLTGLEEQEQGFLLTKGRFVDIILVTIGFLTLLFSFLAFIGITSSLIVTTSASSVPHHRCILYSEGNANQTEIIFGGSGPCYTVFLAPIGSWLCIIPLIIFLVLKIWRRWKITFLVYLWTVILVLLFIYSIVAAGMVSAGEQATCSKVDNLTHPLGGKQSCSQGGAYFNVSMGADGYARFDDWVDLTEAGMWISTLLIFALLAIYIARCVIYTLRLLQRI
ncbi:hypothetical protein LOD99_13061 [Oopsacas minuta]|uniref:Uncharacterized protein n=1 Tax=Oopsacas minuta TaxID=111878 RepID=A0AAV7JAR4_9METZ|nr:hypothetical protein LOD99_13061 [Oopsacas minuta]